jgi:hypothetical protein
VLERLLAVMEFREVALATIAVGLHQPTAQTSRKRIGRWKQRREHRIRATRSDIQWIEPSESCKN